MTKTKTIRKTKTITPDIKPLALESFGYFSKITLDVFL